MPSWKFWETHREEPPLPPSETTSRRFNARPRTDVLDPRSDADPELAENLARLRRRRESVLFDVEQAELAGSPENPWEQRAALIEEALAGLHADRERVSAEHAPPGIPLESVPVTEVAVALGPPPSVQFRIGPERFLFEEDLDWAERGHQLARSELQQRSGNVRSLVPAVLSASVAAALVEHLTGSLFVLASDLRDRAIAGEPLPRKITLADLARPDNVNGGWLDWNGHSAEAARKASDLRQIDNEEQRLLAERDRELAEMARMADRLPIAQRRLADVDAEIAVLGAER